MKHKIAITAVLLALAAPLMAVAAGEPVEKHIESVNQAPDPSAAISAYVDGLIADPHSAKLREAYVRRMVDFGLAEFAFDQAKTLVELDEKSGLGWGVTAFGKAAHGEMADAVADMDKALKLLPEDKFVLHTAGQFLGWYDAQKEPTSLPEATRNLLEDIRKKFDETDPFKAGYQAAREELAEAEAIEDQPAEEPADAYPEQPVAEPAEGTYGGTRVTVTSYPYGLFTYYQYDHWPYGYYYPYDYYRSYGYYYPYYSLFFGHFRHDDDVHHRHRFRHGRRLLDHRRRSHHRGVLGSEDHLQRTFLSPRTRRTVGARDRRGATVRPRVGRTRGVRGSRRGVSLSTRSRSGGTGVLRTRGRTFRSTSGLPGLRGVTTPGRTVRTRSVRTRRSPTTGVRTIRRTLGTSLTSRSTVNRAPTVRTTRTRTPRARTPTVRATRTRTRRVRTPTVRAPRVRAPRVRSTAGRTTSVRSTRTVRSSRRMSGISRGRSGSRLSSGSRSRGESRGSRGSRGGRGRGGRR